MTIQAVAGKRSYRVDPTNDKMVQVWYGTCWLDYAPRDTPKEAKDLVLALMQIKQAEMDL
jgi:hypothetical protein